MTEKPFALTKAEGLRGAAAAKAAGITLGIGHNYRYGAAISEMKRMIDAGALGEIHHLSANLSNQGPLGVTSWRRDAKEAPNGGIADRRSGVRGKSEVGRVEMEGHRRK